MHQLKIKVHKYDQTFPYIREEEDNETELDETKTLDLPQQRQTTALPRPNKQQPRIRSHRRGVKRKFTKCDEEEGLDFLQRISRDEMHKHAHKYNRKVRHQQQ